MTLKGLDLTIKWYLSNSDWIDQIYKSGYEDKEGLNNDKGIIEDFLIYKSYIKDFK